MAGLQRRGFLGRVTRRDGQASSPSTTRKRLPPLESVVVQRSRVELWESILQCQRRDGVFQGPELVFSDFIGAKARLKINKMLGIDGVLAELFASWGAVAESAV